MIGTALKLSEMSKVNVVVMYRMKLYHFNINFVLQLIYHMGEMDQPWVSDCV